MKFASAEPLPILVVDDDRQMLRTIGDILRLSGYAAEGALTGLTQVVILTGNASVESAVRALREQSYDYLIKPVQPERLLDSVGRAGDRWQRRNAEVAMRDSEERLRRIFEHV